MLKQNLLLGLEKEGKAIDHKTKAMLQRAKIEAAVNTPAKVKEVEAPVEEAAEATTDAVEEVKAEVVETVEEAKAEVTEAAADATEEKDIIQIHKLLFLWKI
ncbi:MAG: hypothetical protein IPF58_12255 [Saprospirales bacterium]|nr:hypothetical protein [Saprospirales bacterium]